MKTGSNEHPNCHGCIHRCRHSLNSPWNRECLLADNQPKTGVKEQQEIRSLAVIVSSHLEARIEGEGDE